jgi:hypothetical protein
LRNITHPNTAKAFQSSVFNYNMMPSSAIEPFFSEGARVRIVRGNYASRRGYVEKVKQVYLEVRLDDPIILGDCLKVVVRVKKTSVEHETHPHEELPPTWNDHEDHQEDEEVVAPAGGHFTYDGPSNHGFIDCNATVLAIETGVHDEVDQNTANVVDALTDEKVLVVREEERLARAKQQQQQQQHEQLQRASNSEIILLTAQLMQQQLKEKELRESKRQMGMDLKEDLAIIEQQLDADKNSIEQLTQHLDAANKTINADLHHPDNNTTPQGEEEIVQLKQQLDAAKKKVKCFKERLARRNRELQKERNSREALEKNQTTLEQALDAEKKTRENVCQEYTNLYAGTLRFPPVGLNKGHFVHQERKRKRVHTISVKENDEENESAFLNTARNSSSKRVKTNSSKKKFSRNDLPDGKGWDEVAELLDAGGWTLHRNNNHKVFVRYKQGFTVPCTPSDWRSGMNALSQLKKIMVDG